MAQLDRFLSALSEYKAEALILEQDNVPIFRFLSGNKSVSQTQLGAEDVLDLIEELAPPEIIEAYHEEGTASFIYTLGNVTYSGILEEDSEKIVASIWEATEALAQAAQGAAVGEPDAEAMSADPRLDLSDVDPNDEDEEENADEAELPPDFADLQKESEVRIEEAMEEIEAWLKKMNDLDAADLYLQSGSPAWMRIHGNLQPEDDGEIHLEDKLRDWIFALASSHGIAHPFEDGHRVFIHTPEAEGRFRLYCHMEYEGPALDIHRLPDPLPSADEWGIPEDVQDLVHESSGLILFCGAGGSGTSTTTAAMLELVNDQRHEKVVVMGHPLEFIHESRNCHFTHWDLNPTSENARYIRENVLQTGAGIVMMAGLESPGVFRAALELSESGCLVLGSLPASSAASALEFAVRSSLPENRDEVTSLLARHLRAVVHQSLQSGDGDSLELRWEILSGNDEVSRELQQGDFRALENLTTAS